MDFPIPHPEHFQNTCAASLPSIRDLLTHAPTHEIIFTSHPDLKGANVAALTRDGYLILSPAQLDLILDIDQTPDQRLNLLAHIHVQKLPIHISHIIDNARVLSLEDI